MESSNNKYTASVQTHGPVTGSGSLRVHQLVSYSSSSVKGSLKLTARLSALAVRKKYNFCACLESSRSHSSFGTQLFSVNLFCCRLMNIFLTQFWTENLLIQKPQSCLSGFYKKKCHSWFIFIGAIVKDKKPEEVAFSIYINCQSLKKI